jgi:hypothetical protein
MEKGLVEKGDVEASVDNMAAMLNLGSRVDLEKA